MNHYSPWNSSKRNSLGHTPDSVFQSGIQSGITYAFLEDKENELNTIVEEPKTAFVSPSPSKYIEKRRNYLRTSDRKGMILPELDSVKKKLHFEGQSYQQEMLAAATNTKKKNETATKIHVQSTKSSILKIR